MSGLAGAVVWAVVPFVPEAPFRLYAGQDRAPIDEPSPDRLIRVAERGGDAELTYLVAGKVRPVLVVSDAHEPDARELLALRLVGFGKLDPSEQEHIRAQKSPNHFHLDPARFALPDENAALIATLLRLHLSAMGTTEVGRLNAHELSTVHERIATFYQLDLKMLVHREVGRLLAERRRVKPT